MSPLTYFAETQRECGCITITKYKIPDISSLTNKLIRVFSKIRVNKPKLINHVTLIQNPLPSRDINSYFIFIN